MCWSYLFVYLPFISKTFLQNAICKQWESEEFIEIGVDDILSQVLGTPEYSDRIRARGHDVEIR